MASTSDKSRLFGLAALPALGAALLPALTCPACWPAYAGLLGALGLGFVDYTPYLLPGTLGLVGLAVAALGYQGYKNRRYAPLGLGLVGAVVLSLGKFVLLSDAATYGGMALLVGASLWNASPYGRLTTAACTHCPSEEANS